MECVEHLIKWALPEQSRAGAAHQQPMFTSKSVAFLLRLHGSPETRPGITDELLDANLTLFPVGFSSS
jgi:hypothetical protein